MGSLRFKNSSEERGGRVLSFPRDDESEEGLGFGDHLVGAEEVDHGAVGLDSVAEIGLRREPVEEGEERRRRERMGVDVDEVDNLASCDGMEELLERGIQRLFMDFLDSFGDCRER